MAVTIHDIAKKVGVSPSTVSRVINGKATISSETKEKIFAAMEELNFHPSSLARNLATGSSQAIALIINAEDTKSFANQFFNRSVFGIEKIAQARGFNLIITNDNSADGSPVEQLVYAKKADGIIIPPAIVTPKLISRLRKLHFPFVILGEPAISKNEVNWVDVNNAQGSELAVQHLAAQGYQSIAFIGESQDLVFMRNRVNGFRTGLEAQRLELTDGFIAECDGTHESACQAALALLEKNLRPDAFICSDNAIAYGVISAVKKKGLHIPGEIGVVTFDNYPLALYMEPNLTAVDIDTFLLGEQAAAILFKSIEENGNLQQILINTRLFERESTNRKN